MFELRQILNPFKNEAIAVMMAKYIYINEVDIIQEKVFNIFLLKIFRGEGCDEYLNMCVVFIKKY